MGKKNRVKANTFKEAEELYSPSIIEKIFEGKYKHLILLTIMFAILVSLHFNVAFKGYVPQASDSIQWRTSAQQLMEYNKTHEDQALWNPAIFGGMPSYLISFGSKYPFINQLQRITNKVVNWRVFLMFMMGLGVYILMIHLGFDALTAFISGIAFALSAHFIGLIEIGHNSKFKAIVYIPWIFWSVHYLWKSRNILSLGLTSVFIIGQMRENHPQITYYTFIMLGIFWIFKLIEAIRNKRIGKFAIFSGMLLLAGIISLLAVAQPYFSTAEYGEYTIRGGATGLSTGYATSWSFHPAEILSFFNAGFFGGVSPLYWGWMPFTQTNMYMGVIIFLLAIFAAIYSKNNLVKILMTVSIVTLLLSFGRHFSLLSNLMLSHFPFYNKFRVPAMILVLLQFSVVVMAGFGLRSLISKAKENSEQLFKNSKKAFIVVIVLFIFLMISGGIFNEYGLMKKGDTAKYNAQQIAQLKDLRMDQIVRDGIQSFIVVSVALLLVMLLAKKKLDKSTFLLLISVVIIFDLAIINKRFLQNITHESNINSTYKKTDADSYLLKDSEVFRIYPLAGEFGQNRWCYYHQTLGGYHGAKLQRYQEIIEHCMNAELQDRIPINWNIINMLNAKYVIFNQNIPLENLEFAHYDRKEKLTIFKNKTYLPRAWFVDELEVIAPKEEIWKRLNQISFNPANQAIVEKEISAIASPKSSSVELVEFELHNLKFEVETDTTSFLVISETYYPAGWEAFIDGEKTEIFATNYILRGIKVPSGKHTVEMKFAPKSYPLSLMLSLIGLSLSALLVIAGALLYYQKNYQGKIEYVIKK
ncbi:MAG: YfhO family protein [Candidatus Cloacimonetes bacterium]|nr:YfhO family protein [Candidatus Cloacimonadota bacterium]